MNFDLGPHDSFRPPESNERVPINVEPEVRERLCTLLMRPEFRGTGVGYSAFINRACELSETTIAHEASAAAASARGQVIALGLEAQEFEARNCRCWNDGQYGRVHREDCPIHKGGA